LLRDFNNLTEIRNNEAQSLSMSQQVFALIAIGEMMLGRDIMISTRILSLPGVESR
jgi:hypothetical protein